MNRFHQPPPPPPPDLSRLRETRARAPDKTKNSRIKSVAVSGEALGAEFDAMVMMGMERVTLHVSHVTRHTSHVTGSVNHEEGVGGRKGFVHYI